MVGKNELWDGLRRNLQMTPQISAQKTPSPNSVALLVSSSCVSCEQELDCFVGFFFFCLKERLRDFDFLGLFFFFFFLVSVLGICVSLMMCSLRSEDDPGLLSSFFKKAASSSECQELTSSSLCGDA